MSGEDDSLGEARQRAVAARATFRAAVGDALDWMKPDRLKAEVALVATQQMDEAKAAMRRQVHRHPLAAWSGLAVVAALLTYMLRRPAAALARSGANAARALHHRITRKAR